MGDDDRQISDEDADSGRATGAGQPIDLAEYVRRNIHKAPKAMRMLGHRVDPRPRGNALPDDTEEPR